MDQIYSAVSCIEEWTYGIFSLLRLFSVASSVINYLLILKIKGSMHNSIFTVLLSSLNFIYITPITPDAVLIKHQLSIMRRTFLVVFMIATFQWVYIEFLNKYNMKLICIAYRPFSLIKCLSILLFQFNSI